MHKGRCFRDSRKTARRKARQDSAVTELKRRFPAKAFVMTKFGPARISFANLDQVSKQKLVEEYERVRAA